MHFIKQRLCHTKRFLYLDYYRLSQWKEVLLFCKNCTMAKCNTKRKPFCILDVNFHSHHWQIPVTPNRIHELTGLIPYLKKIYQSITQSLFIQIDGFHLRLKKIVCFKTIIFKKFFKSFSWQWIHVLLLQCI